MKQTKTKSYVLKMA